ncbi:MAG: YdcF family protein [Armatimonadetes bacterium]|nr:YdcF family protein [Armatimonadota bacterium]
MARKTAPPRKRKRRIWRFLFASILIIGAAFLFQFISIYRYSKIVSTRQSDAAIVLGAAAWGTEPSPVLRERLNHAIELYEKGQVKKIITTGGKLIDSDISEAEVSRNYLVQHGIPRQKIYIEDSSRRTLDNLGFARVTCRKQEIETVLIVSDPYHMKRAMLVAKHYGYDAEPSPTQTSMYKSRKIKMQFLVKETLNYFPELLRIRK